MDLRCLQCLLVALMLISGSQEAPLKTSKEAQIFLAHYGYLDPAILDPNNPPVSEKDFRQGLLQYQTFYKLNKTGALDEETAALMNRPRCGNPDRVFKKTFKQ